jgi:hypothetical protein
VRGYASADGYWGGYFTGTTHGLHAKVAPMGQMFILAAMGG